MHRSGIPATGASASVEGWSGVRYRVSADGQSPVAQDRLLLEFVLDRILTLDYFIYGTKNLTQESYLV